MTGESNLRAEAPWDAKDSAELARRYGRPHYTDSSCTACGTVYPSESYYIAGHDWSPICCCPVCGEGEDDPEQDRLLTFLDERLRIQAFRAARSYRSG